MRGRATRRRLGTLGALAGVATLAACASGPTTAPAPGATGASLTVLVASSSDAETQAVTQAVAAWSATSGTRATVRAATDIDQELTQDLASGTPPDLFDVSAANFAGYAARGALLPYGDKLGAVSDFSGSLVQQFTYQGKLYCAPRDTSTLALVINTQDWSAAGLPAAAVPATWDQLAADAKRLTTTGRVGLAFDGTYDRIGVFLAQAGGGLVAPDGKTATVDSTANVAALTYVKQHLVDGTFAYASSLGAASGTEAFSAGKAAMTIAGTWVTAALGPDTPYRVVPLPAGPAGLGTLQFSRCWGIAAASKLPAKAIDLAAYLTNPAREADFATAYGALPSSQSATEAYLAAFPDRRAFSDSETFASNPLTLHGTAPVIADLDARLKGLASGDPAGILAAVQAELQPVLAQGT